MSRVAKAPVQLPKSVQVELNKGQIIIKGPKGKLEYNVNKLVQIKINEQEPKIIEFEPIGSEPNGWAQAGTARAIVSNMVIGVTEGFERKLELVGVGYRVQTANKQITLSLGYSHPIEYLLPDGVTAEAPTNTAITLRGIDKQLLGQIASEIRGHRPPEPYKGKGVKYAGEQIARKEAKKK